MIGFAKTFAIKEEKERRTPKRKKKRKKKHPPTTGKTKEKKEKKRGKKEEEEKKKKKKRREKEEENQLKILQYIVLISGYLLMGGIIYFTSKVNLFVFNKVNCTNYQGAPYFSGNSLFSEDFRPRVLVSAFVFYPIL